MCVLLPSGETRNYINIRKERSRLWDRSAHYTTIDMNSGFWQVPMDDESKQYTAFTLGSMGLYECKSMPFGLCNAPPTFQRLMLNCLGELNLTYCLIYLDDVINFSKTEEEHLEWMRVVFDQFRE